MKFLDFFAGIGGFRLGMEMSGHECVGHCEIDKFAHESYKAIYQPKEWEWYKNDITTVEPNELPEADCYCGGFPCQSFSVAGKRGGFEDTRGTLFFEIMRLAKVRKPKYLFLENVKGLLSHDGGKTFGTILNTMGQLGYDAEYQVLNSKDFGVPQNRERVFIIGHLRRRGGRKVFPIRGTNPETLRQIIGGSQGYRVYDPNGLSCTLASEAGGMGAKTGLYLLNKTKEGNAYCLDANYSKGETRLEKSKRSMVAVPALTPRGRAGKGIANTLDTGCQQGTLQGTRIRKLTPRECFRLQGFPDWAFDRAAEVNSDSQLYKQAGNSVTVNVIYEIAKRL